MKIKYIIILLLLLPYFVFAEQVINGFQNPEAVTSDGKRFFVSNLGQDVISKDADGFISEISAKGKLVELKFAPREGFLNAPKGIIIADNILYVADLERIIGFDINSRKTVFELSIPKATILNDLCLLEKGFIAITDSGSGNIYKVNLLSKSYEIIGNIPSINGIAFNKNTGQLAVASTGVVWGEGSIYLKSANSDFKELINIPKGIFDGIKWLNNEHLLISDWVAFPPKNNGKLWIYDLKNQTAKSLLIDESIANIYYDQSSKKIYMPQMFHNKVIITDIKELTRKKK